MWKASDIRDLPTLHDGWTDDLKIDTGTVRVWLSRGTDEVSVEVLRDGRWTLHKN